MAPPPFCLRVDLRREGGKSRSIPLPLVPSWPLLPLLTLGCIPAGCLYYLCRRRAREARAIMDAGPALVHLCCSLRGLSVEITDERRGFAVAFD